MNKIKKQIYMLTRIALYIFLAYIIWIVFAFTHTIKQEMLDTANQLQNEITDQKIKLLKF